MKQADMVKVNSKGYGKIYKIVMKDCKIPLIAKSIYAYLCAYAGNSEIAFPHRDKILHDLKISKNTFTKYLGILVDAGFVSRIRTSTGNLYKILSSVPVEGGSTIAAICKGYGTVPKLVMLDQNLSAQAKALYAYFCSYAGRSGQAYPHRSTILRELKIGLISYYSCYRALISAGYISSKQTHNGHYGVSNYTLNEFIGVWSQVEDDVDSNEFSTLQQKDMSHEPISCKPVYCFLGHGNTNNKSYNKHTLSTRDNNKTSARTQDDKENLFSQPISELKKMIDYNRQLQSIESCTHFHSERHHFSSEYERDKFQSQSVCVLKIITDEIIKIFNGKAAYVKIGGQLYARKQLLPVLLEKLCFTPVNELIVSIVDYFPDIRNVKKYVQAATMNMVKKLNLPDRKNEALKFS